MGTRRPLSHYFTMATFQIQCLLGDTNVTVASVPFALVTNASAVMVTLKSAEPSMEANFEPEKLLVLRASAAVWQVADERNVRDELQGMRESQQDMPVLVLRLRPGAEVVFTDPGAPTKQAPERFLGMGQATPTTLDYE